MIMFQSDYLEGAHPEILKRLMETNDIQRVGYGEDIFSESARKKIKKRIGRADVDIHFIVGGTITNLLVISSALRQYQGVISPKTGHINVHETGAVEVTGHKVITVDGRDGKLSAEDVKMESTFKDLGIDSLDTVEVLMELEDKLDTTIELDKKIATVGDLVSHIMNIGNEGK